MIEAKHVKIHNVTLGNDLPFVLICGPCQIESRDHAFMIADNVKGITDELGIPFIFKSSYDKANRTSLSGQRGVGMDEGLRILQEIRASLGCPVLTDVHEPEQCAPVAEIVDVLQIPSLLSRQTDLLVAAAKTGRAVNIKKGQFLAPWDMGNAAEKVSASDNQSIMLTERGFMHGYNALVSDATSTFIMARTTGYPVVIDATHSAQKPGGHGGSSGGAREYVEPIARASIANGVAAVFIETHNDVDNAPSDGPNAVRLEDLKPMLSRLKKIDEAAKYYPIPG